jgi:LPXTG-motif cell wall-anchored protein
MKNIFLYLVFIWQVLQAQVYLDVQADTTLWTQAGVKSITYTLRNLSDKDFKDLKTPDFANLLPENLVLTDFSVDTLAHDALWHLQYKADILALEKGEYALPKLPFAMGRDTVYSPVQRFLVKEVDVDTQKGVLDIQPIYQAELDVWDYLQIAWLWLKTHIVWVLLGVLLTLLALWWFWKRKQKKEKKNIAPPLLPAHIEALQALDALLAKQLWQSGEDKQYYIELSYILRNYLERRFGLLTLEQTTDEIAQQLQNKAELKAHKKALLDFLVLADLVKFAKMRPLAEENEQFLVLVRNFVETTKENEQVQEIL